MYAYIYLSNCIFIYFLYIYLSLRLYTLSIFYMPIYLWLGEEQDEESHIERHGSAAGQFERHGSAGGQFERHSGLASQQQRLEAHYGQQGRSSSLTR